MRGNLARLLALVFAAALAVPARAQDAAPPPPDVARRVDEYLRGLADVGLFSGTVLVAKDGKVLVESAYGDDDIAAHVANTTTTRFKLMSVSKTFTAVAVMRLVQDGKLGLDDRVADHLPSWPVAWRAVTVHQLLDHTSGIANLEVEWSSAAREGKERGLAVWKEFAPKLAARALDAPAGTRPSYSNFNYVLLGLVVEEASGSAYTAFVRTAVLAPAGMTHTEFDDGSRRPGLAIGCFRNDDGSPKVSTQDMSGIRGAGDVCSTVGDLWKFDRALRGDAILSAATRATMHTPTAASPRYACGWMTTPVEGRACIHHSGGANGYVADFLRFPDDDACVAVESNFAYAPIARISADLTAILFGRERPVARKVDRAALDACVGAYRNAKVAERTLLVRRCGDALLLFDVFESVDRSSGQSLVPLGNDLFVMPSGEEKLRFTAMSAGKAGFARMESDRGVIAFARAEPSEATWRSAAGAYVVGAEGSPAYRIDATPDGLVMHASDGWPRDLAVVPVTDRLAIVLWGVDGGTLLRLDCDDAGAPKGFRWQRNDGRAVVGVKPAR